MTQVAEDVAVRLETELQAVKQKAAQVCVIRLHAKHKSASLPAANHFNIARLPTGLHLRMMPAQYAPCMSKMCCNRCWRRFLSMPATP